MEKLRDSKLWFNSAMYNNKNLKSLTNFSRIFSNSKDPIQVYLYLKLNIYYSLFGSTFFI